jgi:tRNA threonylcarbamoyladenosine biosynthesis protein TsaE
VKSLTFETESEEETVAVGAIIASQLPAKATVLLIGNLGAGKTTLAKGMVQGRGAGRAEEVSSPTFTLIHEYGTVYHIDLYRLENPQQVANLGLDEIFDRDALVLVEWGERFPNLMPEDRFEIRLTPTGENSRRIEVTQPLPQPAVHS